MNLNQRVNRYLLVTGLISILGALIIILGFAYYVESRSTKTDADFILSNPCTLVQPQPLPGSLPNLQVSTLIECGVMDKRFSSALAIQRFNTISVHLLDTKAKIYDSVSDSNNSFVLFQVSDVSQCGYHYELIRITPKEITRIGNLEICSNNVRMSISRDILSLLAPSPDIKRGYMIAYSWSFSKQKWVTS